MTIRWYGFVLLNARWTICVWTSYHIQEHTHRHCFRRHRKTKIGATNIVENDDDLMEFTHKNLSATILMAVFSFVMFFFAKTSFFVYFHKTDPLERAPFKEANVSPFLWQYFSSVFHYAVRSYPAFCCRLNGIMARTEWHMFTLFWAIHLFTQYNTNLLNAVKMLDVSEATHFCALSLQRVQGIDES